MEQNEAFSSGKEPGTQGDLWYVDNYVLLKDYYDRTISRIAARCVRQGNIAIEEYAFYGYILDVLEEICETGEYILEHQNLYPYVEKKIAGGLKTLRTNLKEFQTELKNNASPEMIKQDTDELNKMKEALGAIDKSKDPTVGAGMSMDEVVEKLMHDQAMSENQAQPPAQQPRPQMSQQAAQPPHPQQAQSQAAPRQPQEHPAFVSQQPGQQPYQQPRQPSPAPQQPRPQESVAGQPQAPQVSPFNNGSNQ